LCRAFSFFAQAEGWSACRGIFAPRNHASRIHTAHQFFIIFVDGMFTTFIACLFTNTSDAIRENGAIACVLHACHAD
jgi:hypothetical protein